MDSEEAEAEDGGEGGKEEKKKKKKKKRKHEHDEEQSGGEVAEEKTKKKRKKDGKKKKSKLDEKALKKLLKIKNLDKLLKEEVKKKKKKKKRKHEDEEKEADGSPKSSSKVHKKVRSEDNCNYSKILLRFFSTTSVNKLGRILFFFYRKSGRAAKNYKIPRTDPDQQRSRTTAQPGSQDHKLVFSQCCVTGFAWIRNLLPGSRSGSGIIVSDLELLFRIQQKIKEHIN